MSVVAVQDILQKELLLVFNVALNAKLVQHLVETSAQCVYQPQQINIFTLQMVLVLKRVLQLPILQETKIVLTARLHVQHALH